MLVVSFFNFNSSFLELSSLYYQYPYHLFISSFSWSLPLNSHTIFFSFSLSPSTSFPSYPHRRPPLLPPSNSYNPIPPLPPALPVSPHLSFSHHPCPYSRPHPPSLPVSPYPSSIRARTSTFSTETTSLFSLAVAARRPAGEPQVVEPVMSFPWSSSSDVWASPDVVLGVSKSTPKSTYELCLLRVGEGRRRCVRDSRQTPPNCVGSTNTLLTDGLKDVDYVNTD